MTKNRYTDDFNQFWKAWPGRWKPEDNRYVKVGKYEAWLEWKTIDKEEQAEILAIVKSGRVKKAGTQYLPDACRWLKKRRYDDFG